MNYIKCQTVCFQKIGPDNFYGFIWVQTVCKEETSMKRFGGGEGVKGELDCKQILTLWS